MKFLTKIKEDQYSISLMGSLIVLISLFLPTHIFIEYPIPMWMWDFHCINFRCRTGPKLTFIPSVLLSTIVLIAASLSVYIAYQYKKKKRDPKKFLLFSAEIIIEIPIIWMGYTEFVWLTQAGVSFLLHFLPFVGLFGIYIGAVLILYEHRVLTKKIEYEDEN